MTTGKATSPNPTTQGAEGSPPSPGSLPPVPRPCSSRAARRSWAELPVRIWVVLTVVVMLITVYFTVTRVIAAVEHRRLILDGVPVMAEVVEVDGSPTRGRVYGRNQSWFVRIQYPGPDGRTLEGQGFSTPAPGEIRVGMELPIRYLPDDPARWTDRVEPRTWLTELTVTIFLVPLILLLAMITLWKRQGVLKIWRQGRLMQATVVDLRQSALAPLSCVVRYRSGDDRRVFSLLHPSSTAPKKGETFPILTLGPGQAVAASLYEEKQG